MIHFNFPGYLPHDHLTSQRLIPYTTTLTVYPKIELNLPSMSPVEGMVHYNLA